MASTALPPRESERELVAVVSAGPLEANQADRSGRLCVTREPSANVSSSNTAARDWSQKPNIATAAMSKRRWLVTRLRNRALACRGAELECRGEKIIQQRACGSVKITSILALSAFGFCNSL